MVQLALRDDVAPDLANCALEAACTGGWDYDVITKRMRWTPVMFAIHDLPPGDVPAIEAALCLYAPESRERIEASLQAAIADGTQWDLVLKLVTARGRTVWVRNCGRATRVLGRTARLYGALQDITSGHESSRHHTMLSVAARHTRTAAGLMDAQGRFFWVNAAYESLMRYPLASLCGRLPHDLLAGPHTNPVTARHIDARTQRGEAYDVEICYRNGAGEPIWVAVAGTPMHDERGALLGFVAVTTDLSRRRRAEAEAREAAQERRRTEALLRDVLEALPSAVTVYDREDRFVMCNAAYADMFPIAAGFAVPGRKLNDVVGLAAAAGQYPDAGDTPEQRALWAAACVAEHQAPGVARIIRLPDGRFVQSRQQRSESGNLVCVRSDATELVRAEAELRLQAERDPLTLLANRSALLRALEKALRPPAEGGEATGALLLFDLDEFKQVNDRYGHDVGDALLLEIAGRLSLHTRDEGDVAARLGGDEFAVVMPGLHDERAVRARVEAIHSALAEPVRIGQRSLAVTVSAGVTLFPGDGQQAAQLLKNADLALYDAKHAGGARWCRFRPEQARALARHVRRADALRQAVAAGQIQVALQPKRRIQGGHAGFEALARWREGEHFVPQDEFMAVAEESGLGVKLGQGVLEAALARIAWLRAQGVNTGGLSVNVTGSQLLHTGFLTEILATLRRHGLAPCDLELEVTEAVLLGRAADRVARVLRDVRARGISLALDNFGIGFASLAQLSHLPINRLKIDRSFIAGIGAPGRADTIVRTIIALARGLEVQSAAEGVETAAQLAFLQAEGCDIVQGSVVARPLRTGDEALIYLRRQ